MIEVTPLNSGLTAAQAKSLLEKYGRNEITKEVKLAGLKLFLSQFKSPLVYILLVAGGVTVFLREFTDAIVIFAAVLINTVLGFYQEKKAQNTLEALSALIVHRVEVFRDGSRKVIEASKIVPGDIVLLTRGDWIPADGVLLRATDFSANEAILTGESMPVTKKAYQRTKKLPEWGKIPKANRVFGGTTVAAGKATMLVVKTGDETEVGKIGRQLSELKEESTPLQQQLAKVARVLALVVVVLCFLIFVIGKLSGYETFEIFITSVAVAVAAIPEGLVVTLTVILALGMQNILRRKAIVRRLLSAETLGSVSTICADKTGTLTEGKMQVVETDFKDGKMGFLVPALCSEIRDPIGIAIWDWVHKQAKKEKVNIEKTLRENPRLDEMPFSAEKRMMATLHPDYFLVAGAPEIVLTKCRISSKEVKTWEEKFETYAQQGLRLVGFAYKENKGKSKISSQDFQNLSWLGVLVLEDPIREGVKEALIECQQAGIKVKIITGDFLPTALSVMAKLGLDGTKHTLTGEELEKMTANELKEVIDNIIVFARTTPEQKLKIVQALKEKGEVVAMTGDGVNDALALKMADIGIVVGEASDVAKETADMVLLDSNFATIVHAVEEGRTIFENIKKVVLFLLSDSFTEIILIGGSMVLGLPLPVTAVQILWVNLVEDTFPGIALAFEKEEKEIMSEPPRAKEAPILDLELKTLIFAIGILTDIVLLGLFYWLSQGVFHLQYIQTVMFVALAVDSLFIAFSCRSLKKTVFRKNPLENKVLLFALLVSFLLLVGGVYLPPLQVLLRTHALGVNEWIFLLFLGIFNLAAIETTKYVFIKDFKRKLAQRRASSLEVSK